MKSVAIVGGGTAGLVFALLLRDKYPTYKIQIIKSDDIGIIGVGEGSTEHWKRFIDVVNINVIELIQQTRATIKIGILFKDWDPKFNLYAHSVGFCDFTKHGRFDSILNLAIKNRDSRFATNKPFENIYLKNNVNVDNHLHNVPSNQFHFDTFKLNTYLLDKCSLRNISITNDKVIDVILNDKGYVKKLKLEKNSEIEADFFVDCTGFKRVVASKTDVKWISKKKHLPMNHAIAFPTEHYEDNFEPYTLSQAMKNGWVWKIPTQDRYGNGYVFCDDFINSEHALQEFNQKFKTKIDSPARDIKFEAGHVDKFWNKNVLCVGLSSSFAEPLEAQSIGFTIVQSLCFLNMLDSWFVDPEKATLKYNLDMTKGYQNVVDFLQLHYFVNRNDSEFWKSKIIEPTDFLKENLPLMSKGIYDMFHGIDGRYNMFNSINFFQVVHGIGMLDTQYLEYLLSTNTQDFIQHLDNICHQLSSPPKFVARHKDYLDFINKVQI